jgi:cell division protein FtsB
MKVGMFMSKGKNPIKKIIINIKFLFILFLCTGFIKISYSQYMKLDECKKDVVLLQSQINTQKCKRTSYLKQKRIVKTEQYIEKMARDKYGMIKPGEKVFEIHVK